MKTNNIIVNAILALAVIALYIIHFTDKSQPTSEGNDIDEKGSGLNVAFVKVDSIILNYVLAQNLNTDFRQTQEAFNKTYTEKRIGFEKEAASFQEKVQRGAFLTQERALQERNRILTIEQEVNKLNYELTNELAKLQAEINQQIVDSLANFLKDYNEDKKYDLILNSTGLLEGVEQHNITQEITNKLNQRYELYVKK
jgi:outer membrane protein